mmetsp:Transcript_71923/g.113987  ORF Transcript_71923/g.113987 Transcript_71923/m.113987 type:complete len:670 (-) Transcript_71923:189-2198(-)
MWSCSGGVAVRWSPSASRKDCNGRSASMPCAKPCDTSSPEARLLRSGSSSVSRQKVFSTSRMSQLFNLTRRRSGKRVEEMSSSLRSSLCFQSNYDSECMSEPAGESIDATTDFTCPHCPFYSESAKVQDSSPARLAPTLAEISADAVVMMGMRDDIARRKSLPAAVGRPFPKRPMGCKLSAHVWTAISELFHMMDADRSNAVTREEAQLFFKGTFGNLSAEAMFNEVDVDRSGAITADEFIAFWSQVLAAGYKEGDILREIDEIMTGAAWVDWKDGRSTARAPAKKFPKRPILCRLSANIWRKCEQLFRKMDIDGSQVITIGEAAQFFKGAFNEVSAIEMFNRVDVDHHGAITAKEFMNFWVQVKASGYSDKDIEEEIVSLLEGNAWVDWIDQREVRFSSQASEAQFPKRPFLCRLSTHAWMKCQELFEKLDSDHSLKITREKAMELFQGAFRNVSVDEMFHRVDSDVDGVITATEFMAFWMEVRGSYSEKEIIGEIDALLQGAAWVDWKNVKDIRRSRTSLKSQTQEVSQLWRESHAASGRTSHLRALEFPKRPFLCKLSSDSWERCAALFERMDLDCSMEITREKAESFFKGSFRHFSVEELFKQVDADRDGVITAEEFMAFWVRVRSSGYKDDDIMQEIGNIIGGGAWVDWEDGRRPSVTPRRQTN